MDNQEKGRTGGNKAAGKTPCSLKLMRSHSSAVSTNQKGQPTVAQVLGYRKNWAQRRMLSAKTLLARRAAQADLYAAKREEFAEVRDA